MKSARLFYQFFLCFSVLLATSLALDDHDNSQQSQWHTPHYGNKNSDSKNVDYYLSIDFARSNANTPNTLPENGRNVIEDGFSARDAQLARLHGLGPAELSVLSLWKQNTRRGDKEAFEKRFPSRNDLFDIAGEDETITAEDENEVLDNQLAPWSKRSSSKSSKAKENSRKGSSNRDKTSGKKGGEKSTDKNMFSNHKHSAVGMDSATASAVDSSDLTQPTQSVAPVVENVGRLNRNLAAQFLLRSPRENRQYDVPIIECPPAEDGMERFACPSPDRMRRYRCIDDHVLCDGFIDCPGAEDEDRQACMFYKTMKAHLDVVADALLRWVRGR